MNALSKNNFTALGLTDITDAARFYGIAARDVLLTARAFDALELDGAPARGLVSLHDLLLAASEALAANAWADLPVSEWRMPVPPPVPSKVAWRMGDGSPLHGRAFTARAWFGGRLLIDLADHIPGAADLRLAA